MTLEFWMQSESAEALGWTLVHSLWEGAAIALALAIVLGITRSSRVRYAAACLAMVGLLISFGVTLYRLMPREISRPAAIQPLPRPSGQTVDALPIAINRTPWDASELLPWLAPLWLAGVLLFQLRCLLSWAAAGRLRRIGVCGAQPEWIAKLADLRARLRMTRPVTLLESCFAEVPVVIGHLRPVILMPVGLLAGLPAGQVEAILLHELAHIRRADYLVNLMQTLVEGLLFYHPAAWWISGAIRNERENCCDDLVVLTSGDAHEYATALAALAENRWTMREAALAATGGNLVKRIRRVLAQPEGPRTTIAPVLSVGILVATGAVALAAWQTPAPQLPIPATPAIRPVPMLIAQGQAAPAAAPAESPYDRWLKEEVVYIITNRERTDFKNLQSDADRERFIEEFWKRRDPTPGTPENEFRDEHYRRIAWVNDRFLTPSGLPGWKTDRGRIYIEYGPPDEIDSHPSGGTYTRPAEQGGAQTVTYPFEMWKYRFIEGIGNNVILEFVDKAKTGDYRLTMDPTDKEIARAPLERERAELIEHLKDVKEALEKQIESADVQMSLKQSQIEQAQKRLEEVEQNKPSLEDAERDLQRVESQLNLLLQKYTEDWPDVRKTRGRLALAKQTRDNLLQEEQVDDITTSDAARLELLYRTLQQKDLVESLAGQHENRVFLSGPGPQASVVILSNGSLLVTIPFEFPAGQYAISVATLSSAGKTVWSNHVRETSNNGSYSMGAPALPPGSYRLTAGVKDTAGSKQKSYVVNFSVK